ncbi:prepilin-type N-terminal cleavage/methylation domain-containing protein [Pedosphaera parvula]|nr:H-X9-DG-CTERM domain-containing protein [Pedosphaera parvula]
MAISKPNAKIGNGSAFSLTELMVVIAIIGILAALLLPTLSQAKGRAQRAQCVSNLHQLGVGLQTFLADHHAYPVLILSTNAADPGRTWGGQLDQEGLGHPPTTNYFQNGVWHCPSAKWEGGLPGGNSVWVSYGYNDDYALRDPTNQFGLQGHWNVVTHSFQPIAESEVAVPSDMMAIGEGHDGVFMRRSLGNFERFGNVVTRHQGKANVLFCDGHVESPTVKFLFEDTSDAALSRWNRDHLPHGDEIYR